MLHQPGRPMVVFSKKLNSYSGEAAQHSRPLQTPQVRLIKESSFNTCCLLNNGPYHNTFQSYLVANHIAYFFHPLVWHPLTHCHGWDSPWLCADDIRDGRLSVFDWSIQKILRHLSSFATPINNKSQVKWHWSIYATPINKKSQLKWHLSGFATHVNNKSKTKWHLSSFATPINNKSFLKQNCTWMVMPHSINNKSQAKWHMSENLYIVVQRSLLLVYLWLAGLHMIMNMYMTCYWIGQKWQVE